LSHREASIGVMVKETRRLKRVANTTVAPKGRKNLPTMPPIIAIGTNTTTSVMVMATAARPISARPSIAACVGDFPIER